MVLKAIPFNQLSSQLLENAKKNKASNYWDYDSVSSFTILKSTTRVRKMKIERYRSKKRVTLYKIKDAFNISNNSLLNLKQLALGLKEQEALPNKGDSSRLDNLLILFRLSTIPRSKLELTYSTLKEKYSFFNHFHYRKTILKKLLKVSAYAIRTKNETTNLELDNLNFLSLCKNKSATKSQAFDNASIDDFSIQRVRFKPGYQVIWRRARLNLQELLGFNMLYQKKLTRAISRFYRLSHLDTQSVSMITAEKIILLSKLLPDPSTISNFVNNKYVFLNGVNLKSQKSLIFRGDFLQLKISTWTAIYSNFLSNWYKAKFENLKSFAKRKLPSRVVETNKLFRSRTTKISAKFLNFANLESAIPSIIEVDAFTMSVIMIDRANLTTSVDSKSELLLRVNIFKNYNWKYLN